MPIQPIRTLLLLCFVFALAVVCYLPYGQSSPGALALDNGIAPTPPMGWNSWNRFGCDVSESLIQRTADAMVSSGMRDAGYQYVVIDDCWQVDRDPQGTIVADPQRFPSGMAALATYVHERGLKFGLYTDAGPRTCMGRPGSLGHERADAATYAAWGVDYVKIDWCGAESRDAATEYGLFRDALAATGRPILLSICTWGVQNPWDWGARTGHMWRTTRDIADRWPVVLQIIRENVVRAYAAGPGGWNDPDMLEVGNGHMRAAEYRTHFSLWAMMAAPLIAGNDLTSMSESTQSILLNRDIIAIDQDPRGTPALILRDDGGPQLWSRPLADPQARAVALFNPTDVPVTIRVRWSELGLPPGPALVRDLWSHTDLGLRDDFTATVAPHDTVMLRVAAPLATAPTPGLPQPPADNPIPAPAPEQAVSYPYLSDIPWLYASSAFGPAERDTSNGEDAPGDGHALRIGSATYGKGLGVHAPAEIGYNLGGRCTVFAAEVGIDAEVGIRGVAGFQVLADDRLIYDSGPLSGGAPPTPVYLDISGVHTLRLIVAAHGSTDAAHADWGAARLACGG